MRLFTLLAPGVPVMRAARRTLAPWDNLTCSGPLPHDPYAGSRSPADICSDSGSLYDEARGLGLTYSLHRPARPDGLLPVVIYSAPMNWGGRFPATPSAYYIAEHLARAGYLAVNIRSTDSDRFVLPQDIATVPDPRTYIRDAIRDPERPRNRFLDMGFLLDKMLGWNSTGALAGHIDGERIGICGHSFGARTAMALIGERIGPARLSYRDARLKAAMVYSLGPSVAPGNLAPVYGDVRVPVCFMGGSRDFSWDTPAPPADRVRPYYWTNAPVQYKIVLKGADHLTFPGGRAETGVANRRELRNLQFIRSISLAFWDAHLRGDAGALDWLRSGLGDALRGNGRGEFRLGSEAESSKRLS
ncbi:hypothetical protein [Emcibacter sp. SYSU 3D8]|uniref:alpha/beta hydrolase family protein n=1 Tax=Emcibacter sp. SYSU 3D8 TaxID=3133969 RepID=UPI0031FEE665